MTLKDLSTGPDWVQWAVLVIFALLSILFLSGRGSCLIAGYNTSKIGRASCRERVSASV